MGGRDVKKIKLPKLPKLPKFNYKNWLKPLGVILVGFIAGIAGTILVLNMAGISITNVSGSSTKTTTSSVSYSNSNDTTKAVEKVQDAVVSVINYKSDSSSSTSDLYNQMFGNDSDSSSDSSSTDDLTVYSEGSGVIYKKDGDSAYVVTNNHVIDGAEQIEIMLADGTKVVGELVGADTYSDIAVVKISSDNVSTVAEFADSDKLTVGETAIAIGSPLGTEYANSVTQGIVSSLSRTVTMTNEIGRAHV